MRRRTWMAGILAGMQLLLAIPAHAASELSVIMNQKQVDWKAKPVLISGRMYVPATDLANLLHGKLAEKDGAIQLQFGNKSFSYLPGQGGKVPKGFLPLREATEKLGHKVAWDGAKHSVTIMPEPDTNDSKGFTMIDATQLSDAEIKFVQQNNEKPGVHQLGDLYMVALGPQPNPGFGIQFVKNVQSWEQLFVHVKRTKPEPGKMYPQVIAYPYLLGRADLPPYTTIMFIDEETGKQMQMIFQEAAGNKQKTVLY